MGRHPALPVADGRAADATPPVADGAQRTENSLYADLLPALARLIIRASQRSQVWVLELQKNQRQMQLRGVGMLDEPLWRWVD